MKVGEHSGKQILLVKFIDWIRQGTLGMYFSPEEVTVEKGP